MNSTPGSSAQSDNRVRQDVIETLAKPQLLKLQLVALLLELERMHRHSPITEIGCSALASVYLDGLFADQYHLG